MYFILDSILVTNLSELCWSDCSLDISPFLPRLLINFQITMSDLGKFKMETFEVFPGWHVSVAKLVISWKWLKFHF